MIGLYAKIPFHNQLRRAEPGLAAKLDRAVEVSTSALTPIRLPSEESYLLSFEDGSRPAKLRAAESARRLASSLAELAAQLHGWNIILETGELATDEWASLKRLWHGVNRDGFFLGPLATKEFSDYFVLESPEGAAESSNECRRVSEAIFVRKPIPEDDSVSQSYGTALERLVDELGDIGVGTSNARSILLTGPGSIPVDCLIRALARLYPNPLFDFLRMRASACSSSPYGPVLEGLALVKAMREAKPAIEDLVSSADRGLLAELDPIVDFLRLSPYRSGYSHALLVRFGLCIMASFRLYARVCQTSGMPAFVMLESADRFPRPSLDVARQLLTLSEEGLVVLATGGEAPSDWPREGTRKLALHGPSPSAMAQAAKRGAATLSSPGSAPELAALAAGDPFRLKLALRLIGAGAKPRNTAMTSELAAAALETLPPTFAEYLLAIALGEGVLTDDDMDKFLTTRGYVEGIRAILRETLSAMGFIDSSLRSRISRSEAISLAGTAIDDGGASFRIAFSEWLLSLLAKRRIRPSVALYRKMKELGFSAAPEGELRLLLDCLSADAVYGSSEQAGLPPPSAPLAGLGEFLSAYGQGSRDRATICLEEISGASSGGRGLEAGIATLAAAFMDYAERRPVAAATKAKNALIGIHNLGAERAEARAHRLLGLCALAQEQIHEATEYFANACEFAETSDDPLEGIFASHAESAAYFTLGDQGKARSRIKAAANWAERAFRADWASACAFIEGRLDFDLGRYEKAGEAFGRVRSEARVYGLPGAAHRAELWIGRAASFAGDSAMARDILSRDGEDPEALWFLAELEAWEENFGKAAMLAASALAALPLPSFTSADSFSWDSGFAAYEDRSVGFASGRSFLRDQISAFRDYAEGMAAGPGETMDAVAESLALRSREDRLALLHPTVHHYLFYRYLLLSVSKPLSMDCATALSKAFKAMQVRSARISESSLKDAFMEGNRWNRALYREAKAHKLI